jgi:hypothetical protein
MLSKTQQKQFNQMRSALITISKGYQTASQLRKSATKQFGLDYEEVIEMSYENIQNTAAQAVKGVKILKEVKEVPTV